MPSSNVSDDPLEETNDSREDEEENGLELRAFLHDDSEEAAAANSSLPRSKRNGLLPSALDVLIPPSPLVHGQHLQVPQDDDELDDIEDDEDRDGSHHHHHTTDGLHAAHGASNAQVAVNIFISFVGAGMLGMPYAFKQSGWFLGGLALSTVSALNVYCMLLLVKSRKYLEQHHNVHDIAGYGDLGRHVIGPHGETFVNICLVVSQLGFATAYIIFISANIYNLSNGNINRATVCFGCIPILALLVQARRMKTLSPFSLIADVANLFGLSAVLIQDFEFYQHSDTIRAMDTGGLLYVTSIALYSLEGVALVLPLETSCADRKGFSSLLIKVLCGITILMVSFGTAGYVAFGDATEAPITLNLRGEWASFVKLALCLALYLTYPIMMFPVSDVLETSLGISSTSKPHQPHAWSVSSVVLRASVVACTALIAYAVPDFGKFLGLVGSSICTILGFILPCYFHLRLFKGKLGYLQWFMDVGLISFGVVFGIMGTIESIQKLFAD